MLALLFFRGGGGQAPPVEPSRRSKRSSRLQPIIDAKVLIRSIKSKGSLNSVVVEARSVEHYEAPIHGEVNLVPIATNSSFGTCTVAVSVVFDIRSIYTRGTVSDIDSILGYSRVKVSSLSTQSSMEDVNIHSSGYVSLTPIVEITKVNDVEISGTQSPDPLEVVQIIHAIRNFRGKA